MSSRPPAQVLPPSPAGRHAGGAGRWRVGPYAAVVLVVWVLPALAALTGYLALPDELPPGQCEGIGFGCTLAPNDGAVFLGVVYFLYAVPGGLLLLALTAGVRWWLRRPRGRESAAAAGQAAPGQGQPGRQHQQ
jgi:hypothetical protein